MKVLVTGGNGFIGGHFCELLNTKKIPYLSVDIALPKIKACNYKLVSILNKKELFSVFSGYKPTHVLHLAAHASMDDSRPRDFSANTVGTRNVLEAVSETASVKRVIVTSSQHVRKPGSGEPKDDLDFKPFGLYGTTKVKTELITRAAGLKCIWCIIRPTNIWGPRHPFLPHGLWKYMARGTYLHPAQDPVVRAYGYVENTVQQILCLLTAPAKRVNRKVFYLGDENFYQFDFVNSFSKEFTSRPVCTVPLKAISLLSSLGDFLDYLNISFPMYAERFLSLTTSNPAPLSPLLDLAGSPHFKMNQGIRKTVDWFKFESGNI